MSFPNEGKSFPDSQNGNERRIGSAIASTDFASAMSAVLNRAFEGTGSKIKVVAKLTGAHERTVKNWFRGAYGPSGVHLVALIQHSDEVLDTFLAMAGRQKLADLNEVAALESKLIALLSHRHAAAEADQSPH